MGKIVFSVIALTMFDVSLWVGLLRAQETELYFLNVGQGDGSLIMLPGAVQILIDGGPPNGKAASELKKQMPFGDRYIDVVAMTHPQLDHFGGLIEVLQTYEVGAFVWTGREADIDAFATLKQELKKRKIKTIALKAGDKMRNGENILQILGPTKEELRSSELNDTSLVVRLVSGELTALYTGDIGVRSEERLAREEYIQSDVLKVAHHGSRFSSEANFLKAVEPKVAIIEVGKNSYGHPTRQALGRIKAVGSAMFRTDTAGTIRVFKEGRAFIVKPRG